MSNERIQVIQAVAERVESYQESAEEGVIEKELRSALAETDVEVSDDEVARLVQAIESGEGNIDVEQVLGA